VLTETTIHQNFTQRQFILAFAFDIVNKRQVRQVSGRHSAAWERRTGIPKLMNTFRRIYAKYVHHTASEPDRISIDNRGHAEQRHTARKGRRLRHFGFLDNADGMLVGARTAGRNTRRYSHAEDQFPQPSAAWTEKSRHRPTFSENHARSMAP
tara:strand:- start:154 stop:612 length:459 start_codon:yes stop_codon:yes gene_type:complete